jgi:hypothetical protein
MYNINRYMTRFAMYGLIIQVKGMLATFPAKQINPYMCCQAKQSAKLMQSGIGNTSEAIQYQLRYAPQIRFSVC